MTRNFPTWAALGALAIGLGVSTPALAGQIQAPKQGHAMNPTWSKDGKYLAFELNTYGGDGIDMFFAQMNGHTSTKVMGVKLPGSSGPYTGQQVVMNATWHPQGIAVFEGSNSGGTFRLYFAQPGGASAAEMLPNNTAPGNLQFPVVDPTGNVLAYTTDQVGKGDVMTWNRSSNKITPTTSSPESEVFPMFDKKGANVLFSRKKSSGAVMYETGADGSGERQLGTPGNGDMTRPVYGGASEQLVLYFSNERDTTNWDLKQMNRSGGGTKTLAQNIRLPERARPAVDPTGKYVAYTLALPAEKDNVLYIKNLETGATKEIKTQFTACGEPALGISGGKTVLAYTALPGEKADYRFLYAQDVTNDLP